MLGLVVTWAVGEPIYQEAGSAPAVAATVGAYYVLRAIARRFNSVDGKGCPPNRLREKIQRACTSFRRKAALWWAPRPVLETRAEDAPASSEPYA